MTAFVRTGDVRSAKTVFNITSQVVCHVNGPKLLKGETKNRN